MSKWYSIRQRAVARASGGDAAPASAEVWIYADIGESWWGETVTAKDFVQEIAALDVQSLSVRINSYGGSVSDGLAIYNALRRHPAEVTVSVDGIAASIASLIAMAGDRVEIAENAMLMIHAPWAVTVGNSADMRERADQLDMWANSMASSYASKTGKPLEDVLALLTDGKDHWYSAAEAVAEGFADASTAAVPVAASLTRFEWTKERGASAATRSTKPAAAAATTSENPMNMKTTPAADEIQAAADQAAAAARKQEAARQSDIRAAFAPYAAYEGAQAVLDKCLADTDTDVVKAKAELLTIVAKGQGSVAGHHVVTGQDERDKMRSGMRGALEIRAGLAKNDTTNPWRGHTLAEMARASLSQAGVRDIPGDKLGMIALAFTHTSSDFPLLLANVAQKSMLMGYDEADETFQTWTNKGSLPDFKTAASVDIGSFPALRTVLEGAEYKYITVGERREQRVLATYGERFMISRQAIINDDLDAFSRIPRKMGRAAIRTVGNLVYAVLTGNPAMSDTIALFNASHNNLQTAGAISTATVDQMRVAMARQKDVGQTSGSLNIRLKYLVVPVSLEGTARVVRDSQVEVLGTTTKSNTVPNSVAGSFEIVSDARLDDASTTIWYGSADPSMNDTVIVDYLDGKETPTLEQQAGWSIDGAEFKVRMDAGVKALDWKTLQRNG